MSFRLVGLGEILWDLLPNGRLMGGAPANFACHARALGADATVVSRVGDDPLGREIRDRLGALGVRTDALETDPDAPTGTVGVELDADGQPHFEIREGVAWDRLAGAPAGRAAVAAADAVCFGSLAQRHEPSGTTIQSLVRLARPGALRIFDINLRQHHHTPEVIASSLDLANVLKVNETELPRLAAQFSLTGDARAQVAALAARFGLRVVAYTRGANGSLLLADDRWSDHPGLKVTVVDTVGAGDSFTAAMTLGLLAGWDLDAINDRANRIAAHVASNAGATPPLPTELRNLFTL